MAGTLQGSRPHGSSAIDAARRAIRQRIAEANHHASSGQEGTRSLTTHLHASTSSSCPLARKTHPGPPMIRILQLNLNHWRGCPGPALRYHQQAAHRRGHPVLSIQEPRSTQYMARRCRRPSTLSGCMEEFPGAGAPSAEYILTSRGPESTEIFFFSVPPTLHQDSLRWNFFPPLLTTHIMPRRPGQKAPLLLQGTSTHWSTWAIGDIYPHRRREPVVPGGTAEIADLRRSCLRARRLSQRSRGLAGRRNPQRELRLLKASSARGDQDQAGAVLEADLCDEVNSDVLGKPYKIAMSRLRLPADQAAQLPSPGAQRGGSSVSRGCRARPTLQLPRRAEELYRPVTLEELKGAQSRIKERSAPGPDGIHQLSAQNRYCRTT
ncbi:unnamed protein product [Trichogramma brassicae]|uniref:Endonuclease/exonuclease/phosphatase domain-containing protein n=1 Tax=Trichogramma brassicae TaxID=86971 RepID=A0A6H5HZZ8_9HYME|nr:unnamed protein product [Trichogramma brassicae]